MKKLLTSFLLLLSVLTLSAQSLVVKVALTDGTVKEFAVSEVQEIAFGQEPYVDLGLKSGIKWASMNVDTTSVGCPGTPLKWDEAENAIKNHWTKHYGDREWRMPTKEEFEELISSCDWSEYKDETGKAIGYKVAKKGQEDVFIVLPYDDYWSTTTYAEDMAWSLRVNNDSKGEMKRQETTEKLMIRPIWGKPLVTVTIEAGTPKNVGLYEATIPVSIVSSDEVEVDQFGIYYSTSQDMSNTQPAPGAGPIVLNKLMDVKLTGLTPNTPYYYQAFAKLKDGSMIKSAVSTIPFVTDAKQLKVDVTPVPSTNSVELLLKFTGNAVDEDIKYTITSKTEAFEPIKKTVHLADATGVQDTIDIDGLASNKLYEFIVEAEYATGGAKTTVEESFTTGSKNLKVTAETAEVTTNSAELIMTISGSSLENVDYEVTYGLNENLTEASVKKGSFMLNKSTKEVNVTLDGLETGKLYYYRIIVKYSDYESAPFRGEFKTIAKTLTVSASELDITATSAKILMTLRGTVAENVDYVIDYSKSEEMGNAERITGSIGLTTNADQYVTVPLSDLDPSTRYYYRIKANYADVEAEPYSGYFETAEKKLLLDVAPSGIGTNKATLVLMLSGNVNETCDYSVLCGPTADLSGVTPITGQITTGRNESIPLTGLEPATTYYFRAEASPADMPLLVAESSFTTATEITYVEPNAVNMGLSVKWADFNLGSKSDTQPGGYFGWGDATGEERSVRSGKYAPGKLFTGIAGDPNYDIATNKLGGHWRLPKPAEVEELIKKCNPTLTTKGAVSGWEFTASNGNKIFIPCAGARTGEDDSSIEDLNKYAYIWTDSVASEGIYYEIARETRQGELLKSRGLSVRPVYDDGSGVTPDPTPEPTEDLTNEIVEGSDQNDATGIIPQEGVDMGKGVKWARWNYGVKKKTGEYGRYLAWGDLAEKDSYTQGSYNNNLNGVSSEDELLASNKFPDENDVVKQTWGKAEGVEHEWRMPTAGEIATLLNWCDYQWTTEGGVDGIKLTSKINGNTLFFPAGGYKEGSSTKSDNCGRYWSSSPIAIGDDDKLKNFATMLGFDNPSAPTVIGSWRYYGMLIRPVYK